MTFCNHGAILVSDKYPGARVLTQVTASSPTSAGKRERQSACEKCANLFIRLTRIVILSSYLIDVMITIYQRT